MAKQGSSGQPHQFGDAESAAAKPDASAKHGGEGSSADAGKPAETKAERRARANRWWERYTTWPMFLLSLIFVALSAVIVAQPSELSHLAMRAVYAAAGVLWVVFIVDYLVHWLLSASRVRFARRHSFELASIIIPYLRPFLLISYVWLLPSPKAGTAGSLRTRAMVSAGLFSLCLVYTTSTVVWVVEHRDPQANIVNWGDAIWWGFTTISTVGYGDFYPVTLVGRSIAILLMTGGVFVIGVVSAAAVSAFSETVSRYAKEHAGELAAQAALVPHRHRHHSAYATTPDALVGTLSMGAAPAAPLHPTTQEPGSGGPSSGGPSSGGPSQPGSSEPGAGQQPGAQPAADIGEAPNAAATPSAAAGPGRDQEDPAPTS